MTKPVKITLNGSKDIAFSALRLSQTNVRRVQEGLSIEELAEDIANRGLLQSLSVRPMLDDSGQETGLYEVPAGGRRFRALERLIQQKRMAKDAPVPCIVKTDGLAEEDSLAENVQRVPLHALDQFHAFKALVDKGMSEEDIAARFFVGVNVVRQRLKLANVAPSILDAYQSGDIPLELVMAFTVNPDADRQAAVYKQLKASRDLGVYRIKRVLTEATVGATDKRVLFVGLEAYVEAGGTVLRDLFTEDNGGWLSDPVLLDRLVTEKLTTEAETIKGQGWKWVAAAADFPYGFQHDLDELVASVPMLSDEDAATLKAAVDEYNGIFSNEAYVGEDLPDAVAERAAELEAQIEKLENPPPVFNPEDMAIAGVFLSINRDGSLDIDAGFVRPEDRRPEPNADTPETEQPSHLHDSDLTDDDPNNIVESRTIAPAEPAEEEDTAVKPLPDTLHRELTAYRTLALRDALASQPNIAFTALLHKLCVDAFYRRGMANCLQVTLLSVSLAHQGPDLKDCLAARSIDERCDLWRQSMPEEIADLWDHLTALSYDSRMQLLAYLISFGVNALFEPAARPGYNGLSAASVQNRLSEADRIAVETNLDIAALGWVPTIDNYLGRVPKARILQAVEQGCGPEAATRIGHLKKGDMAAEAQALLRTSGWLPEPLRSPKPATEPEPPTGTENDIDGPSQHEGEPDLTAEDAELAQAAE